MISDNQVHIPERPGECTETLADISQAKRYLKWEPTVKLEDWINEYKL